jgi:CreA protein
MASRFHLDLAMRRLVFLAFLLTPVLAHSETIGSVDTEFRVLGANGKIEVEAFTDPDIPGVTCYLASARKGGMAATVGLATDSSDASVTCQKTGVVKVDASVPNRKDVFTQSRSALFKTLHVVRFIDRPRGMVVYLTYSDTLVDGSPKNAITAVRIDP